MNFFDKSTRTATVVAEAGRTYYFRTGITGNGDPTFVRAMSADQ